MDTSTARSMKECGEEPLYTWGSMNPVYSPSRNLIYMNEKCAACHGVADGIAFFPVIECSNNADSVVLEARTELFVKSFTESKCYVHFVYGGQFDDIAHLACLRGVANSCSVNSNLSADMILEGCTASLLSPTIPQFDSLVDIMCSQCNSHVFLTVINTVCKAKKNRFDDKYAFVGLLDQSSVTDYSVLAGGKRVSLPQKEACAPTYNVSFFSLLIIYFFQ